METYVEPDRETMTDRKLESKLCFGWSRIIIVIEVGFVTDFEIPLNTCFGCDLPVRALYCFTTNKLFLDQTKIPAVFSL